MRKVTEVDIIIPVYKPDKKFLTLIDRLENQTVPVQKIILMNTEQKYFDRLIFGTSFFEKYQNVSVTHIAKMEFNHGHTRNRGVKKSDAPVFVMMTQDALPADEYMLERLLEPLERDGVAVAYARQLPAPDCNVVERFTRNFNYPEESRLKSKSDLEKLGIKTYFCSNVCAAYNRAVFDTLGGFLRHTIFNEDMIYAAGAVKAGYKIAYAAKALVIHSHNYTCGQQFHRNFDIGVSQADYPEIFAGVPSENEGILMVKRTTGYLWKNGKKRLIPGFFVNGICRYTGYLLGKHYKKLPKGLIKKCTISREYWEQNIRIHSSEKIDLKKGYGKSEEER